MSSCCGTDRPTTSATNLAPRGGESAVGGVAGVLAMENLEPKYELVPAGFPVSEPVPYFAIMLREPNRVRLVNVGPEVVRCVQERLEQLLPIDNFGYIIFKDYQISFTGRFNIYEIVLDKAYFSCSGGTGGGGGGGGGSGGSAGGSEESPAPSASTPSAAKEDMTLIKVVFCRILGALFCYGYDAVTSTDLARDLLTHSVVFFRLRDPHDFLPLHYYSHKFICVAPHGSDSLLLINVPKVAVDPIIKVGLVSDKYNWA